MSIAVKSKDQNQNTTHVKAQNANQQKQYLLHTKATSNIQLTCVMLFIAVVSAPTVYQLVAWGTTAQNYQLIFSQKPTA